MTTDTAPISRESLRLARTNQRLSQRELGRRVAARLGREDAVRALQVRLSRIESGDEVTKADRELVDALADVLALGEDDLGTPPVYVWIKMQDGHPTFVALGLRQLAFTTPENAYNARDTLAMSTGATPMRDAILHPIHNAALDKVLEVNFAGPVTEKQREILIALDPPTEDFGYLWALQEAIGYDGVSSSVYGDLREQAARFAFEDPESAGFEAELIELQELTLRRLRNIPPEGEHLRSQWEKEEENLFWILERIHELRREQREQLLAN